MKYFTIEDEGRASEASLRHPTWHLLGNYAAVSEIRYPTARSDDDAVLAFCCGSVVCFRSSQERGSSAQHFGFHALNGLPQGRCSRADPSGVMTSWWLKVSSARYFAYHSVEFHLSKGPVCLLGPVFEEVLSHTQCKVLVAGATWNHLLSVSWDEAHPRVVLDCINDSCLEQIWVLKIPESVSGRIIHSAF